VIVTAIVNKQLRLTQNPLVTRRVTRIRDNIVNAKDTVIYVRHILMNKTVKFESLQIKSLFKNKITNEISTSLLLSFLIGRVVDCKCFVDLRYIVIFDMCV
jgi:hypothetical protein